MVIYPDGASNKSLLAISNTISNNFYIQDFLVKNVKIYMKTTENN